MSTGCISATPNVDVCANDPNCSCASTLRQALGKPSPKYGTRHVAEKPLLSTLDDSGDTPTKLGCGHADVSCTVVSCAPGRKRISFVPLRSTSSSNRSGPLLSLTPGAGA